MATTRTCVFRSAFVAMLLVFPSLAFPQSVPSRLSALESSVTILQGSIAALQAQVASLTSALSAETASRLAGDASTLTAANAYTDAAATGGTPTTALLAHHFDPVPLSLTPVPVVRLRNVAPGSYVIIGKTAASAQAAACSMPAVGGLPSDSAAGGNFLDDQKTWTLTVMRTATLTETTDLVLNCWGTGAGLLEPSANESKIIAIRVDSQVIDDGTP